MEELVNSIDQCIFSRVSVTISKLFNRKKAVLFQIALRLRGDDFFQNFAKDRQQGYRPVVWSNMLIPTLEYGSYGGLLELSRKVPSFDHGIEKRRNRRGDDGGTVLDDLKPVQYPIRSRCSERSRSFKSE